MSNDLPFHGENYSHLSNKRGVTLIDFEKNPPSTFILTSTAIRDMRVHAGKKLVFTGYLISEIFNQNNLTCILLLG